MTDQPFGQGDFTPDDRDAEIAALHERLAQLGAPMNPPAEDLREAAAVEYPELAPNAESRLRALEAAFEAQQAQHARELADQEKKNELLAAQLREALARPQKLVAPGRFVGREGAPDSPVQDHYTLVLANGDLVDSVHPGVSHWAHGDRLIPVIRVYHSPAIQDAQFGEAA